MGLMFVVLLVSDTLQGKLGLTGKAGGR
jgi:hypothetical protein